MKILLSLIITILLFLPNNLNALDNFTLDFNTDIINTEGVYNAKFNTQISAYYDLRNRQSSVQITNFSANNIRIHVQIFQHDRGCDELNFFDDLTPNDTVVYNMDNIIKNDGSNAPVNLADDSYGYVVVSDTRLDDGINENTFPSLIGNFRIADDSGYEYRTNMISPDRSREAFPVDAANLIAHFNTADNAQFADVVGYAFEGVTSNTSTVNNIDEGFSFDIFVYDMNEEPLSCDRRNFACGNVMNYGINEDYPASRGNDLVCPGGGLANPDGGFISFENGSNLDGGDLDGDGIGDDASDQNDFFVGLIGINNGDGTGSMDTWINGIVFDISDIRLKNNINFVHTLENGIKLYSFRYNKSVGAGDETFVGVMAQDLNNMGLDNTVVKMPNGYYAVNYKKLGLRMATLEEWEEKGLSAVLIFE